MRALVALTIVVLSASSSSSSADEAAAYDYATLDNTEHPGKKHVSVKTGLPSIADARRVCASFCSLVPTCDAFYWKQQADGKDCHLVDYEKERGVENVVGGTAAGKTLYQKTASSAAAGTLLAANNGAFAPNLRPCDLDDSAPLDAATCAGYSSGQTITYFTCSESDFSFASSVTLLSDKRCSNEDRLLECELEGDEAEVESEDVSTVTGAKEMMDKTALFPTGLSGGPLARVVLPLGYVAETPVTKKVTRMIVRSEGTPFVGAVEVASGEQSAELIPLDLSSASACAAHVDLSSVAHAHNATSVAVVPDAQQWQSGGDSRIKVDLFVEEAQ